MGAAKGGLKGLKQCFQTGLFASAPDCFKAQNLRVDSKCLRTKISNNCVNELSTCFGLLQL